MRISILISVAMLAVAAPVSAQNEAAEALAPGPYLEVALTALETRHINRGKVDWPALKAKARELAGGARTPADTYPAIEHVIAALGERHTILVAPRPPAPPAATPSNASTPQPVAIPEPAGRLIGGRIGYVAIPSFMSPRESSYSRDFSAKGRDLLQRHDAAGVCGWIVDLRGNGGGNIWPMIDAVLPLVPPPPYWSYETEGTSRVILADGHAQDEGAPALPLLSLPALKSAEAPLAILTDGRTASSAEGLAIAFKGRPNTRYFGETTADLVTVNNPLRLADGARITMTVGYARDRTGTLWTGPIVPDHATDGAKAEGAAIAWLSGQPGCAAKAD